MEQSTSKLFFLFFICFVFGQVAFALEQIKPRKQEFLVDTEISQKIKNDFAKIRRQDIRVLDPETKKNLYFNPVFNKLNDTIYATSFRIKLTKEGDIADILPFITNSKILAELGKESLLKTSGMWKVRDGESLVRFVTIILDIDHGNVGKTIEYFRKDDFFKIFWPECVGGMCINYFPMTISSIILYINNRG